MYLIDNTQEISEKYFLFKSTIIIDFFMRQISLEEFIVIISCYPISAVQLNP